MKRTFEIAKEDAVVIGEALEYFNINCYQIMKDESKCIVQADISSRELPRIKRRLQTLQLSRNLGISVLDREDAFSLKSGIIQNGEELFLQRAFL